MNSLLLEMKEEEVAPVDMEKNCKEEQLANHEDSKEMSSPFQVFIRLFYFVLLI